MQELYWRADVVTSMPHRLGMGRHLLLDVAVTHPGVGVALSIDGAALS